MDASIAIFASTSRAPQARGYNTAAENIFKIFYHGTVYVLPPVLGSRHEKIQSSLSASQFAGCPLLRPPGSNRARTPHSSGAASFPGGCYPSAAPPTKGVRVHCREAGLIVGTRRRGVRFFARARCGPADGAARRPDRAGRESIATASDGRYVRFSRSRPWT
jgi:hypothetical protein